MADSECIFCKIVRKEIPSEIVHEDDAVVAIKDKFPQAKVHMLVVPRIHWTTINDIPEADLTIAPHMFKVARELARKNRIADTGYRLVFNVNREGGQTIFHVHLHILGGEQLGGSMVG